MVPSEVLAWDNFHGCEDVSLAAGAERAVFAARVAWDRCAPGKEGCRQHAANA